MTDSVYVCLRGLWFMDDTASIQVIARGSQAECDAVAADRPPDMDVDRTLIAAEEFSVISEARHLSVQAEADRRFGREDKGFAGKATERMNAPVTIH